MYVWDGASSYKTIFYHNPDSATWISTSRAKNNDTIGAYNTAFGFSSLMPCYSRGSQNVAVGYNSLNANTIGDDNTAVGNNSLKANTSGFGNAAFGTALAKSTTGFYNAVLSYDVSNVPVEYPI